LNALLQLFLYINLNFTAFRKKSKNDAPKKINLGTLCVYFQLPNIVSLLKGKEYAVLDRCAFYVCVGVSCAFRLLNNLTDFHEI